MRAVAGEREDQRRVNRAMSILLNQLSHSKYRVFLFSCDYCFVDRASRKPVNCGIITCYLFFSICPSLRRRLVRKRSSVAVGVFAMYVNDSVLQQLTELLLRSIQRPGPGTDIPTLIQVSSPVF